MLSTANSQSDFDSPEAAMRFLFGRIDYERAVAVPYRGREFKLARMQGLLDRLGNPEAGLPIVHIAGTKGKGSTAIMLGSILSAAGYRTAAFTSPHLDRLEERIAVAGQPCSADDLVRLIGEIHPAVEAMDRAIFQEDPDGEGPTYFEITTAMALLHFAQSDVDVAMLEVGMGGRLDSTNVCRPAVSVITSISLDHTQQLGDTLEEIAGEKAGIVKPGVHVVSGVTEQGPAGVIQAVCREAGSRLIELGTDFDFVYRPPQHLDRAPASGRLDFHYHPRSGPSDSAASHSYDELELNLPGRHQAANAAVAMAIIAELKRTGWKIPEAAIREGLKQVDWPARIEVVSRRPAVVVDMAHNPASVAALVEALDECFSPSRRLLVFATTLEKDAPGMLDLLLDRFDEILFTRYTSNPRAMPPEELSSMAAQKTGRQYAVYTDPEEAWTAVRSMARPDDLICIAGSVFIAAEMRRLILKQPPQSPDNKEPNQTAD